MGCCSLLQGIFPTQVFCIESRFFTVRAFREVLVGDLKSYMPRGLNKFSEDFKDGSH